MNEFTLLRNKLIESDFTRMNREQLEAVLTAKGALLVLAGAGSGKTTVIVNRISAIIKYGSAYNSDYTYRAPTESDVSELKTLIELGGEASPALMPMLSVDAPEPWQILAITFTNKAANELKQRLCTMLGSKGDEVWASTFHSACVRILRRDGERLGYSKHFTIYDSDDSKRVMKECQNALNIDEKRLPVKSLLSEISKAKDSLVTPEEYLEGAGEDNIKKLAGQAYKKYQQLLMSADAMDFDDIIVNTVKLLRENDDVLAYYQRRFRYVMVDEYQDTNHAQYVLTALLASGCGNICAVGDDDQSIYKFRGATIENILSFEQRFKDAKIIRLEQNYRSTDVILDAANAVIKNNSGRKGKHLWTTRKDGEKITVRLTSDERDEGRYIADEILNRVAAGKHYSDFAVLYRTNAQSNSIERALVYAGVPYRVIGGHRFYDRKEIKDMLAYLAIMVNPSDTLRLRRIINEPKRGIGETTLNSAAQIADGLGITVYEVISHAEEYPLLSRASAKLHEFTAMTDALRESLESLKIDEFFDLLLEKTGYYSSLAQDKATEDERKANVMELLANLIHYYEDNDDATLQGFLEEVALMSDIDNYNDDNDAVVCMTLHSAKGLEFPVVFLAGVEEGLFPNSYVMYFPEDLEEERRLMYVGITRAKDKLYITNAQSRMMYGNTTYTRPSRFLEEVPKELTDTNLRPSGGGRSFTFGGAEGSMYTYTAASRAEEPRRSTPAAGRSASGRGKHALDEKAAAARGFTAAADSKKSPAPEYRPGDSVVHKAFGNGMILAVTKMGNDALLEIAFDKVGTKKLMAKMANLTKE